MEGWRDEGGSENMNGCGLNVFHDNTPADTPEGQKVGKQKKKTKKKHPQTKLEKKQRNHKRNAVLDAKDEFLLHLLVRAATLARPTVTCSAFRSNINITLNLRKSNAN